MGEVLVVRSKVKALAKKKKMNLGGDAVDALTKEVLRLVDRAAERAKANRRSTIKGRDI
jgi:histone H3/H4